MSLIIVTPPAVEPVALDEMMRQLNLSGVEDIGSDLPEKIAAARLMLERFCGIGMIAQTVKLTVDCFPAGVLELPRAPLMDVVSVEYFDAGRVSQTLPTETYVVRGVGDAGVIAPAASWPETDSLPGSVAVTYRLGYGAAASDVPRDLRQAVRMLAAHFYENREATFIGSATPYEMPFGVHELVASYRRWCFA